MKDAAGYQLDDLRIDTRTRRVSRRGADLQVAGLTYDLLMALVLAAPKLLSTEELLQRVWPEVIVSPETLTQRIKLLRQALGDSAEAPHYVAATRGHGYRLIPAVISLAESSLAVPPKEFSVAPPAPATGPAREVPPQQRSVADPRRPMRHYRSVAVSVVALLAIGGLLTWLIVQRHSGLQTDSSSAPRSSGIPAASVAVMPFANLTGDPGRDYLGDGMAEELISALAQLPGLKVPARTSTFAYKGRSGDVRRIAQDLGVAAILEGSVRSAGERLRISARLVDAASGFQIWSQDYDRQSSDIFQLQDDLAAQIVQALRMHLKIDLPSALPRTAPTKDVEAYDLYLRARASANGTAEGFLRGITLDDEALARDPAFARALADRADHRMALVAIGHPLPQGLEQAERDARQALSLDRKLSSAYAILGAINALRNNWVQAEINFRAAIAADPSDGYIRAQHATFVLASTGRLADARAEAMRAYQLAPAHGFCSVALVLVSSLQGTDADTSRYVELAIQRGSAPQQFAPFLAQVAVHQRRYEDAGTQVADALPPGVLSIGGAESVRLAYRALGEPAQRPRARRELITLVHKLDRGSLDPLLGPEFMYLLASLDARDEAFALIRRADAAAPSNGWELIFWAPDMKPLRQDERFQALVRERHFVEFWQRYGPPDGCTLSGSRLSCP
jgi:TolB-like protein/DNA-binding winged helix-turn-helix (wHTH) protein/Tfp pilus assembly protein PilF